jgi:hypothetical protein
MSSLPQNSPEAFPDDCHCQVCRPDPTATNPLNNKIEYNKSCNPLLHGLAEACIALLASPYSRPTIARTDLCIQANEAADWDQLRQRLAMAGYSWEESC